VAGFAVLICLRLPDVILHGRFWAEEGKYFYVRAATDPPLQTLFAPFGGYLNLVANGASLLARALVPLEYAPWVTTGIALVFQCLPAILLAYSRDRWLQQTPIRIACLLIVATAPAAEEVWLQTLHSQFHLALCCALILALDVPTGWLRAFGFVALFLAPLCGPSGAALVPLFLLRAVLDRSGARLLQGLVLASGAALQLGLFYSHHSGRSYGVSALGLLCVAYIKLIVLPFLGRVWADPASAHVRERLGKDLFPLRAVAITVALLAGLLAMLVRRGLAAPFWLVAGAGVLFGLGVYGSLSTLPGLLTIGEAGRYTFIPQVLLGLALAAAASGEAGRRWEIWLARGAVIWLLGIGLADISRNKLFMGRGPNWRAEVAAWRRDPAHPIAIWPPGWVMTPPQ